MIYLVIKKNRGYIFQNKKLLVSTLKTVNNGIDFGYSKVLFYVYPKNSILVIFFM